MALTEVCEYLRNWFDKGRFFGTFRIINGSFTNEAYLTDSFLRPLEWPDELRILLDHASGDWDLSDILQTDQYFRVVGSVFNDGVYRYPATGLHDEVFEGALWVMAVPPSVITLNDEIDEWQTKYGKAASSPFSVESITSSSYSRTRATGEGLGSINWQTAFGARLARWRKI